MKKIYLILSLSLIGLTTFAQFPNRDSLRNYIDKYIRNSAVDAFTNLRLNTSLKGILNQVDSTGNATAIKTMKLSHDSVFGQINGVWIFQYKDTVGTAGGGGGTTYTAGNGINITGTVIKADTSILATKNKLTSQLADTAAAISARIPAGGGGGGGGVTDTAHYVIHNVSGNYGQDTMYWFGDSHVEANGGWVSAQSRRYSTLVSNKLGYYEKNNGVGGTLMTNNTTIIPKIPNYSARTAYLLFEFGTNDAGSQPDTTGYRTNFYKVIDSAVARGWPTNKIVIITPSYINPSSYTPVGKNTLWRDCAINIARDRGCISINVHDPMRDNAGLGFVWTDGLHNTEDGNAYEAYLVVNKLLGNVKFQGQDVATNGIAEFKKLALKNLDTAGYSITPLVLDSANNVRRAAPNAYIKNSIGQFLAQGASFNISGTAQATKVVTNGGAVVATGNGAGVDPGNTRATEFWDDASSGYLAAFTWPGLSGRPLSLNGVGGSVTIGTFVAPTTSALNIAGATYSSGPVHGSGSYNTAGNKATTAIYYVSGHGSIQAYDANAGVPTELYVNADFPQKVRFGDKSYYLSAPAFGVGDSLALITKKYADALSGGGGGITGIFRKVGSDSVFYVLGGSNVFAFRDSIGSGSGGGSFVDLTTTQTITGQKTFNKVLNNGGTVIYGSSASAIDPGVTAKGLNMWTDGSAAYLASFNWPGATGNLLSINGGGGVVQIGAYVAATTQVFNVAGGGYFSGPLHGSGAYNTAGTKATTAIHYLNGHGAVTAYDGTANSVKDLWLNADFSGNAMAVANKFRYLSHPTSYTDTSLIDFKTLKDSTAALRTAIGTGGGGSSSTLSPGQHAEVVTTIDSAENANAFIVRNSKATGDTILKVTSGPNQVIAKTINLTSPSFTVTKAITDTSISYSISEAKVDSVTRANGFGGTIGQFVPTANTSGTIQVNVLANSTNSSDRAFFTRIVRYKVVGTALTVYTPVALVPDIIDAGLGTSTDISIVISAVGSGTTFDVTGLNTSTGHSVKFKSSIKITLDSVN